MKRQRVNFNMVFMVKITSVFFVVLFFAYMSMCGMERLADSSSADRPYTRAEIIRKQTEYQHIIVGAALPNRLFLYRLLSFILYPDDGACDASADEINDRIEELSPDEFEQADRFFLLISTEAVDGIKGTAIKKDQIERIVKKKVRRLSGEQLCEYCLCTRLVLVHTRKSVRRECIKYALLGVLWAIEHELSKRGMWNERLQTELADRVRGARYGDGV